MFFFHFKVLMIISNAVVPLEQRFWRISSGGYLLCLFLVLGAVLFIKFYPRGSCRIINSFYCSLLKIKSGNGSDEDWKPNYSINKISLGDWRVSWSTDSWGHIWNQNFLLLYRGMFQSLPCYMYISDLKINFD